ncbi:MAG TPA: hypothetical protein VJL82_01415 [Rhizomicrobium sp.]|nr:hypothetical protein [Rhizomicrobium sp.]
MTDISSEEIEYRTPCRLSDLVRVQLWCTSHAFRYLWIILAIVVLLVFVDVGGSFNTMLQRSWDFLLPLIFGLVVAFGIGPVFLLVRWALGKMPKEIRANINSEGVKIIGETVNFEARWSTVKWVKESSAAYRIRFKALLVRLPKRGFISEQEAGFRKLVQANVPASSNRLK